MEDIRIAAAIFRSPGPDIGDNLDRMIPLIRDAKSQGVQLICFPEMNVSGYSTGPDIASAAEPIPGRISSRVSALAREHGIVVLAGMAERDEKGRLFVSHLAVSPDGIIWTYRKIHMAPPEKKVYSQGDRISLFDVGGVRCGVQLCYDAHFPELSTLMAQKGADVIFMPHASPKGTPEEKYLSWMRHLPARAYDNSLYVVACNQTGFNRNGLYFPGVAMVIDPSGKVASRDISGEEGILVTDLSRTAIDRVRSHKMRFFFPNRRPRFYDRARSDPH